MEGIRKALAVSIGSRGFVALLGLLALPWYVRFLGIEAYGVIGLFASLQVLVAFMELGLATTLTRELAGIGGNRGQLAHGRSVALTYELAYLALAALIALLIYIVAPLITSRWINLETLRADQVSWALGLAGIALACQWPTNLYSAGLAGLHLQTPLALSTSAFAALRVTLSLVALRYQPTLESFFIAQIISALLQSAGTRVLLWRGLALRGHRPVPRLELLLRSRAFAGGMTAITITSVVLIQMDKVILSYLLRLPDFGLYVIASSLATGLYILISPVFSVIYPRLSASWCVGDLSAIIKLYHASSQVIAVLVLPLAMILICFPTQVLFVLTGNTELSVNGSSILMFLAIGSALNGIMNIPYALQLASGWTSLSVWINLAAIVVLAPATWLAATRWGAAGGAAAWAALNLGYLLLTPQVLHYRLISDEKWRWYLEDVLQPAAISLSVALLFKAVGAVGLSRWLTALQLTAYWVITEVATLLALGQFRHQVIKFLWK